MASFNHLSCIPNMKAFAWSIGKKSHELNCFNTETGPGDKWSRKGTTSLIENPTILIVAHPGCLIL